MATRKRILLVDDDPAVAAYLAEVLTMLGHSTETTGNGVEALKRMATHDIDLVISDLNMPGEPNGLDLIRGLREIRRECPIVVISGYPTQDRLDVCEEIGVRAFLTKPFELSFIRQVLREVFPESSASAPAGSEGGLRS